jgi:hypothetical protein
MNYAKIVTNPYSSLESKGRKGLMVEGPWDPSLVEFIARNEITALYLNGSKGWSTEDYSFLSQLKTIEELDIIAAESHHLDAMQEMPRLQELSLTTSTDSVIDFARMQNLEDCFLHWWKGAQSIFDAPALKSLYLDEIKIKSYAPLERLTALESLTLGNSNIEDLSCLKSLQRLTKLELLNCRKIVDFSPIASLKELRRLRIEGSKQLCTIDFVASLKALEVLLVGDNGTIDSLQPVAELKQLKAVAFNGSSKIGDGNLACLTQLPQLAMLMFASRRHYTHRLIKPWSWKNFDSPDTLLAAKA